MVLNRQRLLDQIEPSGPIDDFRTTHLLEANRALADVLEANPGLSGELGIEESVLRKSS